MIWKQATSSTTARLPLLSASEQTRLSWARPVKSYAAVPEVFKGFFEPYQSAGREFPYIVLTPAYEAFIFRTTEKLICDFGRQIVILDRNGNTCAAQGYHLEGISYVEVRSVLLDSRIKIAGVTEQGAPISSTLRFNSVTDYLFTPILEKIRRAGADSGAVFQVSENEKFEKWVHLNYKFMNYARCSLLGGENVLHAVLQPEIRLRRFTFLGKTFYKTIAPTLVSILTDRELIVIREEIRQIGGGRYGGVWDYIPLTKILKLALVERDDDLLVLSIRLPEDVYLECLFQASNRFEIDQLLARFREVSG